MTKSGVLKTRACFVLPIFVLKLQATRLLKGFIAMGWCGNERDIEFQKQTADEKVKWKPKLVEVILHFILQLSLFGST